MTDHTIAAIALLFALSSLLGWSMHVRLLRAALAAANAEFDEAHLAAAALSADHGSPAVWRRRAQLALRAGDVADRQRIADASAQVAAFAAREMERTCAGRDANPYAMVRAFHALVGQPDAPSPDLTDYRINNLRMQLINEERKELLDALSAGDVVEVADALADLMYVVIGSALQWGIPLDRVFAEVHRSNMTKTGGAKRDDGKILKGPGYEPPDVSGVLAGTVKR